MTARLMVCLLSPLDNTPVVTIHDDVHAAFQTAQQLAGSTRLEWLPDTDGWFSQCDQYSYCLIQCPAEVKARAEEVNV